MATSPAVSSVKEKVTRERIIPPAELAKEKSGTMPDFWEYIEGLRPEDWSDHIAYLYRDEPKASTWPGAPPAYLDKFVGAIEVRPGYIVQMDDAGNVQQAIKEKFGGRVFRLILKKGKERITECRFTNEAQPKYPESQNNPQFTPHPLPNAGAQSDTNVVTKAMDIAANQPQEAINIAMGALRTVSEIITKQATNSVTPPAGTAPAAGSLDGELDRAFKAAMIKKLMDPPADPVDTFLRIRTALGDGGAASNPLNNLLEPLLKAAIDKIVNPVAPVTGRTTLLDLGREFIPVLGSTVRETMHEYRLSVEAQARIAELTRGMPQAPAAPPPVQVVTRVIDSATPSAAAAPNPAPAAAAAPTAPPMTFQQIEAHIAKIESNVEFTVEEAVDKVLEFLYDTDPRIVPALLNPPSMDARLKPGKDGLLMLFTAEPALQPCLNNLPRLSEFLDKFIAAATEAEKIEANLRAAAPGAVAPTATPV